MHRHLFTPILLLICTFLIIHIPITLCADDQQYVNCRSSYKCGDIDITYPFWGVNRPEYCGYPYPDFELVCDQSNVLTITINTTSYRVLAINYSAPTLTVARQDYWGTYCPTSSLFNASIDLNFFSYTSTSQNIILYYGCPSSITIPGISVTNQFTCPKYTVNGTTGYYLARSLTEVELALSNYVGSCNNSVKLPVFESAIVTLNSSTSPSLNDLIKAIDGGFGLAWAANNSRCDDCEGSGGQCGYNTTTTSGEFICYCADKSYASTCSIAPAGSGNKSSSTTPLIIGLAAAGSAIAIGFGFLVFFRAKQRKHKIAALSKSKSLPTPPSSNGLPTPTTNFSRTTPSYPSSLSTDLEKGSMYFGVQVFTYNELEEATDNFDPARELGEGGFGVVYYGKLRDGRVVAVKRLYENNLKRVEQFINEIAILARLRHQNLVTLYGCTSKRSQGLLLVYEYIPNGTVADHLHGNRTNSGLLTWSVRLSIAIETASALTYLHKSDIIHRDVKTNNILLDNDFRVKVADFGLVRDFPTDVTHVSTAPQGTPGYVDPEYYQCYQLTDKSDVYSFGVVLVELISSLPAVDTNRHRHDINLSNMAINKIQNHTLHELVDPCLGFETDAAVKRMTTLVAELAFRCLQQDRDMRPTMEEVLESLRIIENEELNSMKSESVIADDVGLLKNMPLPFSPDSTVSYNWANSTAASTF